MFLSTADAGGFFNYAVIFILAIFGGMLGTLLMIPLRGPSSSKSTRPSLTPEGHSLCLRIDSRRKGGQFAKTAFQGLGIAFIYALLQKMFKLVAENARIRHREKGIIE